MNPTEPQRDGSRKAAAALAETARLMAEEVFAVNHPPSEDIHVSRNWSDLTGMTPNGSVQVSEILRRIHPDDHGRFLAEANNAVARRAHDFAGDLRFRHEDGSWRWLRYRCTVEYDTTDQPVRILAVARDVTHERRMQDVFERMVRHNALMLNAAGEGIVGIDGRGRTTFANPAAAKMLGASVPDLVGVDFCRFVAGCGQQVDVAQHATPCLVRNVLTYGREIREYNERFVGRDGVELPVQYVATPLAGERAPTGAVIVFSDISERVRAERRFASLVESAPDALVMVDRNGNIAVANAQVERLFGYPRDELVGRPVEILVPERFRDKHPLQRQWYMEQPKVRPMGAGLDLFGRHKDGREIPVEISLSPIETQDGVFVMAAVRDVSDRRRAEEAVRRERRFNDGLIKSSLDGIVAYDRDLQVTMWNPAMEHLTGIRRTDAIGKPLTEIGFFSHAGDEWVFRSALAGTEGAIRDRRFTVVGETPRAPSGHFEARISPLYDPQGHVIGGLSIVRDITEAKARDQEVRQAREQLVRSEKLAALGTLVSGVAHELRTPMSYINNHLYLIRMAADRIQAEQPDMEPVAAELLKRADASMKGIERMSKLLDDLRATYRPQGGEAAVVDLGGLVAEATRVFVGAYEGPAQVTTDLEVSGEVFGEPGRIQQVVINLLNNAAEALPDGGEVHVALHEDDGHLVLSVRDEGMGMDEATRAAMFKPFFTTKASGTGLGLYLVKQIVERHGGRIDCTSAPGEGTLFRVWIPVASSKAAAALAEASARHAD